MNFAAFIERHARSIILVALALAVAGVVSAISLPVGLFPQVAFPRVVVDLDAGSRPADQTALLVTRPVEEAIRTVPGVLDVRSATTRGTAQISVDFGWGRDMVGSTLLVDAAVSQILPNLPPGHRLQRAADGPDGLPDHLLRAAVGQRYRRSRCTTWRSIRSCRCCPRSPGLPASACRAAKRPRSRCWPIRTGSPATAWP